jgi:hypothetical protein
MKIFPTFSKVIIGFLLSSSQILTAQEPQTHTDTWRCGTSDTPQYQAIPTASLELRNECGVMRDTLYSTMIWYPRVPLESNFAREVKKFIVEKGDPYMTKAFAQIKSPRGKPIVIKTTHIEMDTAFANLLDSILSIYPAKYGKANMFVAMDIFGRKSINYNYPAGEWIPPYAQERVIKFTSNLRTQLKGDFHEFMLPNDIHPDGPAGIASLGSVQNQIAVDNAGTIVMRLAQFLVEPTDPEWVKSITIIKLLVRAHEIGHALSLPHSYLQSSAVTNIQNVMSDRGGNGKLNAFTEKTTLNYDDIFRMCMDSATLVTFAGEIPREIRAKWWNEGEDPHVDMIQRFLPYFMANNKQRCTTKSEDRIEENINVFPNPISNNTFTISKPLENNALDIVISNTMGQIILRKTMLANDTALDITLPTMSNGLYFIHILDNKTLKKGVKKIVIQN